MDVWGVDVKREELSFAGAAILLGMDSARTLLTRFYAFVTRLGNAKQSSSPPQQTMG